MVGPPTEPLRVSWRVADWSRSMAALAAVKAAEPSAAGGSRMACIATGPRFDRMLTANVHVPAVGIAAEPAKQPRAQAVVSRAVVTRPAGDGDGVVTPGDRKSTRLNSSHQKISYA